MMKATIIRNIFLVAIAAVFAACNVTKKLPENEQLYTGATIKIKEDSARKLNKKEKKQIVEKLKPLLRPKPNKTILGWPYKLWVYQAVGTPKKEKGIRQWLRTKLGEPPVLASSLNLETNTKLLNNKMENMGYFHVNTVGDTTSKAKKLKAIFTVNPGWQYTIRKKGPLKDSILIEANSMRGRMSKRRTKMSGTRSLIKEGMPYDLDAFITERERIDTRLKRRGYYYFNPHYILMRVDSTVGNHQVDVFMIIKPETPEKALQKYYINNIYIYPRYDIALDTLQLTDKSVVQYSDFHVIDPSRTFKPQVFERTMFFNKGDVYNERNQTLTLNRLVSLNQFKFVKNKFQEVANSDTPKLDVYYYLTPLKKKAIRTELTGKGNTAGYAGGKLDVNWRNRNLFRGAEMLNIKVYTGLDFQVGGQNKGYNVFSAGVEGSLTWPRIVPINFRSHGAYIPRTKFTIGYDWQKRMKLYTLNTARTSYGFYWKGSEKEEHEFNIANITYVKSSDVTQEYYDKIRDDSSLAKVIEKQLIMGPTYIYTWTNTTNRFRKHTFYYQGGADFSGNIIGLIEGANAKNNNYKEILGVRYSQYIKTDQDFRYFLRLGRTNQWASRLFMGVGIPYGNSLALPFIKQYFSGGTQSLRGFRSRSVGPGTYRANVSGDDFLPDATADIKLELNTELRFKILGVINGAFFVDAGNIWLKNEDTLKPGGKFTGKFLNELAVDAGFGLRFDFSILILRTDFGFPLRKPWLPDGQQWTFDSINFKEMIFNLAIGMPF
jgi:outer membrane protein insertion porin family